jgi:uncharacterized protein YciW
MTVRAADQLVSASPHDFIDRLTSARADAPALRNQRPDVKATMQACFGVLLGENASGGLTRIERLALALRVAHLNDDDTLSYQYRSMLQAEYASPSLIDAVAQAGSSTGSQALDSILRHADSASLSPGAATPADVAALTDSGFTTTEIVVVTQIIGLVHLQCRVLRGLQLLGAAR